MAVTKTDRGLVDANESVPVTGTFYPETQPVSGTVTANQGAAGSSAWPVSVASLPTPSGASTLAAQGQWRDTTGTLTNWKSASGKPRISAMPYTYDIAEGNIANHYGWLMAGYNPSLTNQDQTFWAVGGVYVFPTTAMQMEVVSSSVNDTSAGTGAQTVTISYLNGSFQMKTEVVTLAGTAPVLTAATDIYRVNGIQTATVGTGGVNAGNVDIRNTADTPVYCRMATGTNKSMDAVYTVPAGMSLYITSAMITVASNVANRPVQVIIKANVDSLTGQKISFFVGYSRFIVADGVAFTPFEMPLPVPAGVDIKITGVSPDGAAYGAVAVRGWIEVV